MSLFAFFGFWETTLLAGAGAASIPVIIHLLNRRRYRVVIWAAMHFLLAAQRQNTRKMRLEQLLLLAVRIMLILLVVLAMAAVMPWAENLWAYFWPEGAGFITARAGRTHKILVLDGSLSMNLARDQGKNAFDQARQLAHELVQNAAIGDGFSVALMKDTPTWIVGEISQDARKVARELEGLQPTHGNASLTATLNLVAAKALESAGRFQRCQVFFFTDLQKATWAGRRQSDPADAKDAKENSALDELHKRAQIVFVDVGRDHAQNLAVTDLALLEPFVTTGSLVRIRATVQNFSREDRRHLRVELLTGLARETANDPPFALRVVGQELLDVKAGERATLTFGYKFTKPGTYAIQVRLDNDDLEPDDLRSVVVPVKDTIPVLLVNGKPAPDRFDQATEFLRLALNPFPPRAIPRFAPLRPKVLTAPQFADVNEAELASYDCVYLCDVGQLGSGELRRLESHVRSGGGLVISLGEKAADHLEAFNRLLFKNEQGLLPARLLKKIRAPADHHFVLHGQEDTFLEPPLKAFADDDDRASLFSARFGQYVQVKPAAGAQVRKVLSFIPEVQPLSKAPLDKSLAADDPALLEWYPPLPQPEGAPAALKGKGPPGQVTRCRGKVVLFTSTMNLDWTSWPGSPSYGAMMQELLRSAASGRLRERAIVVGGLLEEVLPAAGTEADSVLHLPGSLGPPVKVATQLLDDINLFRFAGAEVSGIYRLQVQGSPRELPLAVNVPAATADQRGSESDLSRLDQDRLREEFAGWTLEVVTDPRAVRPLLPSTAPGEGQGPGGDEETVIRGRLGPVIANYALLAFLVLLLVEIVMALYFGHASAVPGTVGEPPRQGLFWPTLIGSLAGILFVAGAGILIHAAMTGDFLGFLPDSFRGWVEQGLGIPPPPAGENTHWELDFLPFLGQFTLDFWLAGGLILALAALVFFIYRDEAPTASFGYKILLGSLRMFLLLLTLFVLLPQLQFRFERQGWPDLAIIVDDSRSMGEPDHYQDAKIRDRARILGELVKKRLSSLLPEKIKLLETELSRKQAAQDKAPNHELSKEVELLELRFQTWQNQLAQVNSPNWRPTRLQLAQALLDQDDPDWLQTLLSQRRMKIHLFHLDRSGRLLKLTDIQDLADSPRLLQARQQLGNLEAEGKESRLGTALREVLDYYRGSTLTAVVMLSDGITTRDQTIAQATEYAAQKGVPLFFVGIGDDHQIRDLKLHDLQVEDTVFVGDRIIFEARLTGQGYKDVTVPVVLKLKDDKEGKEQEVAREMVRVDSTGKAVKVRLRHQATEVGPKTYIVEVETPKIERPDKGPPPGQTRLERTIEVLDTKLVKVLYIEGTPRYEFRFIKSLLERESPNANKKKAIDLKVVLLDADPDFPVQDRTALGEVPIAKDQLDQYDVIILGDVEPKALGEQRLRHLAEFVRGEDSKGRKGPKTGGGLLMIAGPLYSPHAYRDTPLAEVLPIEPSDKPPPQAEDWMERFRLELTPLGRMHPIFRFSPDEGENQAIANRLASMYWWSSGFRLKPLAEVLATHPRLKGAGPGGLQPLVVQQFVGSGRSMFFGFDESWRWRYREDELRFNQFWIQTMRYLSRNRQTRTELRLDRQTPYRVGEPIKVTVRFPDNLPEGPKPGTRTEVKVMVEYRPPGSEDLADPEVQALTLAKVEGNWGVAEGLLTRTREGQYRFWLSTPDVSKQQPGGKKPSALARVELPPGELDRLRMNQQEMLASAEATQGKYYDLVTADRLLQELPQGMRLSLSTPRPPVLLWNHLLMFGLVLLLFSSEWILRKRKHLL